MLLWTAGLLLSIGEAQGGKRRTPGFPLQILTLQLAFCPWMCWNASALQLWSCRFWVTYKSWRLCCFSRLVWVSCCSCWCQWNCACPVQEAVSRLNPNPRVNPTPFWGAGGGKERRELPPDPQVQSEERSCTLESGICSLLMPPLVCGMVFIWV